jgi:hypothetical protein
MHDLRIRPFGLDGQGRPVAASMTLLCVLKLMHPGIVGPDEFSKLIEYLKLRHNHGGNIQGYPYLTPDRHLQE